MKRDIIKGFAVKYPQGALAHQQFSVDRGCAIRNFLAQAFYKKDKTTWKQLYRQGYRCVKATLREDKS